MKRICKGVEYEGSPEELARFESLVERPQVTVNQQEPLRLAPEIYSLGYPVVPRTQDNILPAQPSSQVVQHNLTEEQKQRLYLTHSKEFVGKLEQAVIKFKSVGI
jgi:hypothetical protein